MAQDSAALKDRLEQAETATSLDLPGMKPWHLLMSFQLFDGKGKQMESGTIEEWWTSPTEYKISTTSPSYTATFLHNTDGAYRSLKAGPPPYFERNLLEQVVHPMPRLPLQEGVVTLLSTREIAKVKLDCIAFARPDERGKIENAFGGRFPVYCFDQGRPTLRISTLNGAASLIRIVMGRFEEKSLPLEQAFTINRAPAAEAKVQALTTTSFTKDFFQATSNMVKVDETPIPIASSVMVGKITKKIAPRYPDEAKWNSDSGTVLIDAVIGKDGHIQSANLLFQPTPSLGTAALDAVKQWEYTPPLQDGQPVAVETLITVNFAFRR